MTIGAAPRALLRRPKLAVELTPSELHILIAALEQRATAAADDGIDDFADFLFCRIAELRETAR